MKYKNKINKTIQTHIYKIKSGCGKGKMRLGSKYGSRFHFDSRFHT
jgi:hypothetical protein